MKEVEAKELKSLVTTPLISDDPRLSTLVPILTRQVSQEVTRFLTDALRNANSLHSSDYQITNSLISAICNVIERFEGSSIHIDCLFALSRVVRENVTGEGLVDTKVFFAAIRRAIQSMNAELCIEAFAALSLAIEEPLLKMVFVSDDRLVDTMITCLQQIPNQPQLHYNVMLCLWLVSFDKESVKRLIRKCNIVSLTVTICRATNKEKVVRMGVGLWRSLLEKEKEAILPILIGSRAYDFVMNCVKKNYADQDLNEDLHYVSGELEQAIQKLSTFDEYSSEVKSGNLEWTPPHKSLLFWKDNASRLNDNNGELLRYATYYD
jgi:hypothetical protein